MQRDKSPRGGNAGAPCPEDGKIRYYSRRDALRFGRQAPGGRKLRAYRCGEFWHLTSQDTTQVTWYREHRREPMPP
jgi:hypothetical protein